MSEATKPPDTPARARTGDGENNLTIVVGYDGSAQAKGALGVAIELAAGRARSRIVVTCGRGRPPGWFGYTYRGPIVGQEEFYDHLAEEIANDVEEAARVVREAGVEAIAACTNEHPVDTLLTVARDTGASIIVVGAKGAGGLQDVVMGSTTMRLLHKSTTPVLVVPSSG